jgi:hypothetical protein
MKRMLASAAIGAALVAAASTEASAWVCRAVGFGSSAMGRDYNSVVYAKLMALRECERNSPVPVCTILWCREGV